MSESDDQTGQLPAFVTDPRGVLRRRWPWVAVISALGIVATAIFVARIPVTYLATASLLVSEQKIPEAFVPTTVESSPLDRVDALVGEILAREQLVALIEKHGLYLEYRDTVPMLELVGVARSNVIVAPGETMTKPAWNAPASMYTVSFRDMDPAIAATMANELATLFTAAASRISGQAARLTTDFMRAELERSERQLREQERLIAEFKEQYRGELPAELAPNSAKLDRLTLQRQTTAEQLAAAETRLADLEQLGDLANPSSPYARLSALRAKLAQEMAVNTEEHPNVLATRRQIEALEQEVAAGGISGDDPAHDFALRSARQEVSELRASIGAMAAEARELEERVARTPEREEELTALTQKATVLQETYVENLRKLQAAELAQSVESAHQGARVEVLDRAVPPTEPERTRLTYLAAGVVASLLAAAGAAMLLELFDPVLVSAQQIEEELGLPVLGTVGRVG